MALAAAQVVDALAARLVPVVLSGGRVFTSRTWPLTEAELPAWRVTAAEELVEPAYIDGGTLNAVTNRHTLSVEADGYVRATADLDDRLHDLAEAGITALLALPAPHETRLVGIDRRMETQGEAAIGAITLRLESIFYVRAHQPGVIV